MKNLLLLAAASASLMACQKETIDPGAEKNAIAAANAASAPKVVLPPSITASKVYRCKDNSVVYVDWLSDGNARVKNNKEERSKPVTVGEASEAGAPSLTGDATAATVTYSGQSCKA